MMGITIRAVGKDERAKWEELFRAYAEFYRTPLSDAALARVWGWIFDAKVDFWCDIAATDDAVVGLAHYQLMLRSLDGSMTCYLSDLYVEPPARGAGAGRALMNHVVSFAETRGLSNVRWLTQEFNHQARRLYDSYRPRTDFILYNLPVDARAPAALPDGQP